MQRIAFNTGRLRRRANRLVKDAGKLAEAGREEGANALSQMTMPLILGGATFVAGFLAGIVLFRRR